MRGAISLAAALAVSTEVDGAAEILLVTFGVIAVTLLGQGLTLPLVLRALRLPGESRWSPDEALARLETAQAALDRLEELEDAGADGGCRSSGCATSIAPASSSAWRRWTAPATATRPCPTLRRYGDLRRELIAVERRDAARPARAGPGADRGAAPGGARPRPRRGSAAGVTAGRGSAVIAE